MRIDGRNHDLQAHENGVKVVAPGKPNRVSAPLRLTVDAIPDNVAGVREAVVSYAKAAGIADVWAVALAISEAVTNVVVHAYRDRAVGQVRVVAEHPPDDGLIVTVEDEGGGFVPRDDSPGMGLGLAVVAQLAEAFEVAAGHRGGTLVRMTFE
jgi:serine/threonine-protein kinase RsbW